MRNSFSRPPLLSFGNMRMQPGSWEQKVHPFFTEAARAYRDTVRERVALGSQPPAEKVEKVYSRYQQKIQAIRARHADAQHRPSTDDPLDVILVDAELC